MKEHFGVARGFENVSFGFKRGAQFAIVVNLAVENNGELALRPEHWLRAAWRKVNDGKSPMAETDAPFRIKPIPRAVWTARGHLVADSREFTFLHARRG